MPKWLSTPRIAAEPVRPAVLAWAPTFAAVAVLLAAPPYQAAFAAQLRDRSADATRSVRLPVSAGAWRGPVQGEQGWRPLYRNGLVELQGTYRGSASEPVYAFVAVYGLGATAGAEMISYDNVLFEDQHKTVSDETRREVKLAPDRTMTVREVLVPEHAGGYLVWHWYMFGVRPVTNPFIIKALEAMALVTSAAATERSVTLATPLDERARERLQSFVVSHPDCVASGFAAEACGG